jgi:hypothetical protein
MTGGTPLCFSGGGGGGGAMHEPSTALGVPNCPLGDGVLAQSLVRRLARTHASNLSRVPSVSQMTTSILCSHLHFITPGTAA